MELLNHFVAARLMKDAQLFERIGQHGRTPQLLGTSHLSSHDNKHAQGPSNGRKQLRAQQISTCEPAASTGASPLIRDGSLADF